jgi:Bor protein
MKLVKLFAPMMILGMLASCTANLHTIGDGPKGNEIIKARQWYVLWGIVPINQVDTKAMAAGAEDYQIKTVNNFDDGLITFFTSAVTVSCRTVQVTK